MPLIDVPSSPYLEFETGTPFQKAVVFSGIAEPDWDLHDDGTVQRQTYTVHLGYPVLAVCSWTGTVGLASIYHGESSVLSGDSPFLYATDAATLSIDADTQELQLQVNLALLGDPANLSRFGYQIVVLLATQETGISGTISYPVGAWGPANPTLSELVPLLKVSANTVKDPAGGGLGNPGPSYNPVAFGILTGLTVQGGYVNVTYNIAAPPYNLALTVLVDASTLVASSGFSQTPEATFVTLTVPAPDATGIDFLYFDNPVK